MALASRRLFPACPSDRTRGLLHPMATFQPQPHVTRLSFASMNSPIAFCTTHQLQAPTAGPNHFSSNCFLAPQQHANGDSASRARNRPMRLVAHLIAQTCQRLASSLCTRQPHYIPRNSCTFRASTSRKHANYVIPLPWLCSNTS